MPPIVKKKGAWIAVVAVLVLAWGILGVVRGSRSSAPEDTKKVYVEGDVVAPTLPLSGLAGTPNTTFAAFAGKPVLINFWAGWCGPCLKEMPSLYKLQEKYRDRGFQVLAFNMDENADDGLATLERTAGKPTVALYRGYDTPVFYHFPIEGLPFTVLVDRTGKVTYAQPGERDWMDAESQKMVEAIL